MKRIVESFFGGKVKLRHGDCISEMKRLRENSIDAVITDPPYHLASIVKRFGAKNAAPAKSKKTGAYARAAKKFIGKKWDDGNIAFRPDVWREALRVLKPGGTLLAMASTQNYHRLASAIEEAGFEVRDCISWLYGTGFPKRKTILKPAQELICLARKPLSEKTVEKNIERWGVPTLNIEGDDGRWPNNVIIDGSMEVASRLPDETARFFYSAKANADDRACSEHPTIKPVSLMAYLVRLVAKSGAIVLDPFAGTGTTAEGAMREGAKAILIEADAEYIPDIRRRMRLIMAGPEERAREILKHKLANKPADAGPLFA